MSRLTLTDFLHQLPDAKRTAHGYMAKCPAHPDKNPSLSLREDGDKVLIHCHAGCTYEAIIQALGIKPPPQYEPKTKQQPKQHIHQQPPIVYPYQDESGQTLYEVVRLFPKSFRQRQRRPDGSVVHNLQDVRKVLFRLPQLRAAIANGETIYLCEGEKDALACVQNGLCGTTNAGGAQSWESGYSDSLRGANVVVLVDRDDAGHRRAERLHTELKPLTKSLRFLVAKTGKDAHDHFAAGHSVEEFQDYWEQNKSPSRLMSLAELMDQPPEDHAWTVDGLIPLGSFNVLIAKPKVGKSSLVRELIRSVLLGEPFLGRQVMRGPVVYLALEERQGSLREFFAQMEIPRDARLFIALSRDDCPDMDTLRGIITAHEPALVIIDTLIRFVDVKDLNDYAEVSQKLAPISNLSRETDTTILVTHHSKKGDGEDAGDSTLGSTAIFGMVDTLMRLRKDPSGNRSLNTEQRYGTSMESTFIRFDPLTHRCWVGETVVEDRIRGIRERILEQVGDRIVAQSELRENIRNDNVIRMLNVMVEEGVLEQFGTGRRGSPFFYGRVRPEAVSVSFS